MINRKLKTPLYQQLYQILKSQILNKDFLPGEKFPSERKIAILYKVNRMIVKKAIGKLVLENLLYRITGKGTFVTGKSKENYSFAFSGSNSLSDALKQSGKSVSTKILRFSENCESPFLRKKLNLDLNDKVESVHRLRYANDCPFAIEYTYVPQRYFPDFLTIDFRTIGLYDYMKSRNYEPKHFQQYITIVHPTTEYATLLNLDAHKDLVYKMCFTSADKDFTILEYTESYINPNNMKMNYEIDF